MGYSGAILIDNNGRILFQLRDEKGRNPNKWGIFGGGINKGEDPTTALVREIKEELDLSISQSNIINHYSIPIVNYHIFEVLITEEINHLHLHEGKAMRFMTKKEFLKTKNALRRVKIFLKLFMR